MKKLIYLDWDVLIAFHLEFFSFISMQAMRNLQDLSFTNLPWLDVCFAHFVFAAHEPKMWNFHSTKIYNDNNIKTVYYCWSQATVAGYWRLIEIYSARQVSLSRCVCACMIACSMLIQPNTKAEEEWLGSKEQRLNVNKCASLWRIRWVHGK